MQYQGALQFCSPYCKQGTSMDLAELIMYQGYHGHQQTRGREAEPIALTESAKQNPSDILLRFMLQIKEQLLFYSDT
jgi:hypothetical protein